MADVCVEQLDVPDSLASVSCVRADLLLLQQVDLLRRSAKVIMLSQQLLGRGVRVVRRHDGQRQRSPRAAARRQRLGLQRQYILDVQLRIARNRIT